MKKFSVLLLTVSILLGLVACTANTPNDSHDDCNNPYESNTVTPESNDSTGSFAEEVTLKWAFPALLDEYPGFDAIVARLNEITKEKINAKIEFEMIPLAEYTDRMNIKIIAGEEFDLCFTGAWNPFLPAVSKGAYAELTQDILYTYAPDVVAELNSSCWDAVRVNGKIYGIPIQQIHVRQSGIRFNTELLQKYGFDPTEISTLDDLDTYAETIHRNEPGVVPIFNSSESTMYCNMVNYLGYDVLVSEMTPGVVYYNADVPVVINQFETEEFAAFCHKMRQWELAGYFPADAVTGADSVAPTAVRAIDTDPAHKPGGDITEGQLRGYNITGIAFGDCAMTTSAVQATVTAVSSTSRNVERTVAFINLLNSDPEVLNLICHGIEGVDYEFVGDKSNKLIKPISEYPGMLSFFVGNVFNEYYTDELQIGTWEETRRINANAKASCALGFVFNTEPVSSQIAQCNAVAEEYIPALSCGAVDVDYYLPAFQKSLKEAGADEIIAEMQRQIDEWFSGK